MLSASCNYTTSQWMNTPAPWSSPVVSNILSRLCPVTCSHSNCLVNSCNESEKLQSGPGLCYWFWNHFSCNSKLSQLKKNLCKKNWWNEELLENRQWVPRLTVEVGCKTRPGLNRKSINGWYCTSNSLLHGT